MWDDLETEIGICTKCHLERIRTNPVTGKGNKQARVLFILENVSKKEDLKNDLLTDKKGEYFKKFLEYSKMNLSECYFTTLTKCSSHDELIETECIIKCRDYLTTQIALLNPEYIITVGEIPTKNFIKSKEEIREMVGKIYGYTGGIKIIPIYDLSYLLKAGDKEKWQVVKILEEINRRISE